MVYFCPMTFFRRLNTFTQKHLTAIFGALIFIVAFVSYVATLAPAQVPGDPDGYTFIQKTKVGPEPTSFFSLHFIEDVLTPGS